MLGFEALRVVGLCARRVHRLKKEGLEERLRQDELQIAVCYMGEEERQRMRPTN